MPPKVPLTTHDHPKIARLRAENLQLANDARENSAQLKRHLASVEESLKLERALVTELKAELKENSAETKDLRRQLSIAGSVEAALRARICSLESTVSAGQAELDREKRENARLTSEMDRMRTSAAVRAALGGFGSADTSPDKKAKGGLKVTNQDRISILNMYDALLQANPGYEKGVVLKWLGKFNPQWATVTLSNVCQYRKDLAEGIVRGQKRDRNDNTLVAGSDEVADEIFRILAPLSSSRALFSSRQAWSVVESRWTLPVPPPTKSVVYDVIKKKGGALDKSSADENVLSDDVRAFRIHRYRLEYAYVRKTHRVHPRMIVNIDESAIRLVPTRQHSWVFEGVNPTSDILKMFPLRRVYTTLTAACSQAGKMLPLMINWKGTERLVLSGIDETKLIQCVQADTHWNTTTSFVMYIKSVVIPYFEREWAAIPDEEKYGYTPFFMLVIDCAPIHISLKTRTELQVLLAGRGACVYLPAGCTDRTQPLDVGVFGAFKARARVHHLDLLVTALQNRPPQKKMRNLATTTETRYMACIAIMHALDNVSESAINNGWDASMGKKKKNSAGKFVSDTSDTLETLLSFRCEEARLVMAMEKEEREKFEAAVVSARAKNETPPRHPEAAKWIFRFGLPHGPVVEAKEAEEDAIKHEGAHVRFVSPEDAPRVLEIGKRVADDEDENVPIDDEDGAESDQDIADGVANVHPSILNLVNPELLKEIPPAALDFEEEPKAE